MIHSLFILAMEILVVIGAAAYVYGQVSKLFKTHAATVSMATGDQETLSIQTNLSASSTHEERKARLDSLFELCKARRVDNHNEWLRIKAEAEAENKAKGGKLTPVS